MNAGKILSEPKMMIRKRLKGMYFAIFFFAATLRRTFGCYTKKKRKYVRPSLMKSSANCSYCCYNNACWAVVDMVKLLTRSLCSTVKYVVRLH
jgi:hypothetical protein